MLHFQWSDGFVFIKRRGRVSGPACSFSLGEAAREQVRCAALEREMEKSWDEFGGLFNRSVMSPPFSFNREWQTISIWTKCFADISSDISFFTRELFLATIDLIIFVHSTSKRPHSVSEQREPQRRETGRVEWARAMPWGDEKHDQNFAIFLWVYL